MLILILGVALWWAAHLLKRLAPDVRAKLGDEKGKGPVAIALFASIVLMVVGYRMADGPVWWGRSSALVGINNLLMLLGFYFFAVSGAKTALSARIRHPMLLGFKIWAFAHLIVNGDLASFILFGGLLGWAVVQMVQINRAEPEWTPPAGPFPVAKEIGVAVTSLVIMLAVALLHWWLGAMPFG